MRNTDFLMRSEEEKRSSVKNLLLHKTHGVLSQEQMRRILLYLRNDIQYEITVHTEPETFLNACIVHITRERADRGFVIFGEARLGCVTDTGRSRAEMPDDTRAAAALISQKCAGGGYYSTLHLYIPKKLITAGAIDHAKQPQSYCI